MSSQFSTRMKMKQPLQYSRTPGDEKLKRIEISFAKQDFTQRISLQVNNACAARGGAARMTLSDCRNMETELTQTFAHGLRIRRRWFSLSRRLKTSAGEHRGPTPTCEQSYANAPDSFCRRAGFCFVPQAKALCVCPARRPRFKAREERTEDTRS
jgi:hypothetical protein